MSSPGDLTGIRCPNCLGGPLYLLGDVDRGVCDVCGYIINMEALAQSGRAVRDVRAPHLRGHRPVSFTLDEMMPVDAEALIPPLRNPLPIEPIPADTALTFQERCARLVDVSASFARIELSKPEPLRFQATGAGAGKSLFRDMSSLPVPGSVSGALEQITYLQDLARVGVERKIIDSRIAELASSAVAALGGPGSTRNPAESVYLIADHSTAAGPVCSMYPRGVHLRAVDSRQLRGIGGNAHIVLHPRAVNLPTFPEIVEIIRVLRSLYSTVSLEVWTET